MNESINWIKGLWMNEWINWLKGWWMNLIQGEWNNESIEFMDDELMTELISGWWWGWGEWRTLCDRGS